MSKIVCPCGHIIVDQADNLPYKAAYYADEDYEASFGKYVEMCSGYIKARDEERQEAFIIEHFGKDYPRDLESAVVISDLLAGMRVLFGHTMYECEQCGRLLIFPVVGKNRFVSYTPEGEVRGVLRSDNFKDGERFWHPGDQALDP
jgi:hypothetical protein